MFFWCSLFNRSEWGNYVNNGIHDDDDDYDDNDDDYYYYYYYYYYYVISLLATVLVTTWPYGRISGHIWIKQISKALRYLLPVINQSWSWMEILLWASSQQIWQNVNPFNPDECVILYSIHDKTSNASHNSVTREVEGGGFLYLLSYKALQIWFQLFCI